MNNKERQTQQVYKELEFIQKKLKLTDYLSRELKSGQILYSVYLSDCMFTAYRDIKDNEMIYTVIRDFEERFKAMVYHCLVSRDFLVMLYVADNEEWWEMPFVINGTVALRAAVYNMQYKFTEIGDVGLAKKANGLVRVW